MARPKIAEKTSGPLDSDENAPCFTSGSFLLDLVLGGRGWAHSRMANLVGDKSTGKTLLAIEACANLARITGRPDLIRYGEAEDAFDEPYARSVGCPEGIRLRRREDDKPLRTIEDFYRDLEAHLELMPGNIPGMYVLDSLDSLSSEAELERGFDAASYGDGKAKKLSEMFRRKIQDVGDKKCTLLIISQIRDKLNVMFGETKTRSGGHALDFYASQVVWLAQVQTLTRTVRNIKRPFGVLIKAKNKKCKVGTPYRDAELPLLFGYGMDDEVSMLEWLKDTKVPLLLGGEKYDHKEVRDTIEELRYEGDRNALRQINNDLRELVAKVWYEIDAELQPRISKYD